MSWLGVLKSDALYKYHFIKVLLQLQFFTRFLILKSKNTHVSIPAHSVPGIPRRPPSATPTDVCLRRPSPSAAPSTRELLVLLISLGISKSQQSGPNRWQLLAASTTMYLPPAASTQHHPASSYGRERRHLPAAGSCPAASLPTTGSGRQHRGAEKL
jgi:hypothetical protein